MPLDTKARFETHVIQWWQNEAEQLYQASRYHRRNNNPRLAVYYADAAKTRSGIAREMVAKNMGIDTK